MVGREEGGEGGGEVKESGWCMGWEHMRWSRGGDDKAIVGLLYRGTAWWTLPQISDTYGHGSRRKLWVRGN